MEALPPIELQQGLPFDYDMVWQEDDVGVNMTGWTGTVTAKANFGDDSTLFTATPALGAAGEITFDLTAAQTAGITAQDRQGQVKVGFFQIRVTNGTTGQVFQGDVYLSAAL